MNFLQKIICLMWDKVILSYFLKWSVTQPPDKDLFNHVTLCIMKSKNPRFYLANKVRK